MAGPKVCLTDKQRRAHERYKASSKRKPKEAPYTRTGNEYMTNWRYTRGTPVRATTIKDYKLHSYQTRCTYDGEVMTLSMVVDQDWSRPEIARLIKRTFPFDRHICVLDEMKGTDRYLMQFFCRQENEPSREKIYKVYKQLARLSST